MKIRNLSLLLSTVLLLTVFSFPQYFLFLPNFDFGVTPISIIQILSSISWVVLIVAPPLFLWNERSDSWSGTKSLFFLVSIFAWPASTICIQLATFAVYGTVWLEYLIRFPIFLFMDILVPLIYLAAWISRRGVKDINTKSRKQRKIEKAIKTVEKYGMGSS